MHVSYRGAANLTSILQLVWHHNIASSIIIISTTICCISSDSNFFKGAIGSDIYSVLPRLLMQLLFNFNYHLLLAVCSSLGWFAISCSSVACYRLSNSFLEVFSVLDADQSFGDIWLHFLSLVLQSGANIVSDCCALLLSVTVINCLHRVVLWTQVLWCQHWCEWFDVWT